MCTQQLLLQSVCCANGKRELGVRKCAFRKKLAAALFCMIVFSREGKTVSQTMFVTGSVTSTEKFEWSVTSSDSLYTQTNTDSCSSDLHCVEHLLPRWKSLWVIDKSAGHVMWEEVVAASKNVHNQVHKFMNLIWFFLKVCVWKVGLLCCCEYKICSSPVMSQWHSVHKAFKTCNNQFCSGIEKRILAQSVDVLNIFG